MSQTFLTVHNSDEGQLLQQSMQAIERTVFLSPKGDDLRVEDMLPADNLKRWMQLQINPDAKISMTRQGAMATIALDGRNSWQLRVRGARIRPMQQRGFLVVEATTAEPINWALKRVVRTFNKTGKPTTPELPF